MGKIMITEKHISELFTKEQIHFIWNAMHTYIHIENSNGVLLNSEVEAFEKLEPIFRPGKYKKR